MMKMKKFISKALVIGLIVSNISVSNANIMPENERFETLEGNNITANDILESGKVNIDIEGDTLVNLADIQSEFQIRNLDYYYSETKICETSKLKTNTDYTLFVYKRALRNNNKNYKYFELGFGDTNTVSSHAGVYSPSFVTGSGAASVSYDTSKRMELVKINLRFTEAAKNFKYLNIRPIRRHTPVVSNEYGNADVKIVLLEGDYTNKDIPYFKGVKSGFDNQLVTQEMVSSGQEKSENLGKYKVEIKSTGKNLLNGWVEGLINSDTGNIQPNYDFVSSNYIPINFKKTYAYSGLAQEFYYYDSNYTYIGHESTLILDDLSSFKLSIPDGSAYVRIRYPLTTLTVVEGSKINSIEEMRAYPNMLEENDISTEYEPYKESVKTLYLNSPLLKGDTIEVINGQANHVSRYKEIIFDGSSDELWTISNDGLTDTATERFAIHLDTNAVNSNLGEGSVVSNYPVTFDTTYQRDEEIIQVSDTNLLIRIQKSRLNQVNPNGLREWLRNNPITVVYKLKNPIYEPLKTDLLVNLFKGVSHISNSSNILNKMKITVDRTPNIAAEAIELAKTNPTSENLSRARMWVNMLEESTLKDEFQGEINSIINVSGITLERKNVTANLDLYIKSENALSMSLSTNSVTFDNYSGVEDIELENAIEISINSSLPYDLNAYLESEIQNKDKSTTMDMDLLKIKDSSKDNYQSFINTSDKVVLIEDHASGNFNNHNIDLKLQGDDAHSVDVYKTTIRFEAMQK